MGSLAEQRLGKSRRRTLVVVHDIQLTSVGGTVVRLAQLVPDHPGSRMFVAQDVAEPLIADRLEAQWQLARLDGDARVLDILLVGALYARQYRVDAHLVLLCRHLFRHAKGLAEPLGRADRNIGYCLVMDRSKPSATWPA
ncbi:hypothetical protein FQZ97_933260 [compost metagenome]